MGIQFIFFAAYLCLCFAKTGRIKAEFFDFNSFRSINANGLQSAQDIQPTNITAPEVVNFVFNIGTKVLQICDKEDAIACIKFKGDPFYYSISSANSWDHADAGLDINFASNVSVIFTLPKTIPANQRKFNLQTLQLKMVFTCSNDDTSIVLSAIIPSSIYKLEIFNPVACQSVFDYYSETCYRFRIFFAIMIFFFNIWILIPMEELCISNKKDLVAINGTKACQILVFQNFVGFALITFYTITATNSSSFNSFFSNIFVIIVVDIFIYAADLIFMFLLYALLHTKYIVIFALNSIVIALIVYNICFFRLNFYISLGACFLFIVVIYFIFFFRSKKIQKEFIFLSKTFYATFAIVRGFAGVIGGYPNELEINTMLDAGLDYPWTYYIYLSVIFGYVIFIYLYFVRKDKLTLQPVTDPEPEQGFTEQH